jgi:hypothetical protein
MNPPPSLPGGLSEDEARLLAVELRFAVPEETFTRTMIWWGDRPVHFRGSGFARNQEHAEALVRGMYTEALRDWLARLPPRLRVWADNPDHRREFLAWFLAGQVRFVPANEVVLTFRPGSASGKEAGQVGGVQVQQDQAEPLQPGQDGPP